MRDGVVQLLQLEGCIRVLHWWGNGQLEATPFRGFEPRAGASGTDVNECASSSTILGEYDFECNRCALHGVALHRPPRERVGHLPSPRPPHSPTEGLAFRGGWTLRPPAPWRLDFASS